jgi:hypothetical protein
MKTGHIVLFSLAMLGLAIGLATIRVANIIGQSVDTTEAVVSADSELARHGLRVVYDGVVKTEQNNWRVFILDKEEPDPYRRASFRVIKDVTYSTGITATDYDIDGVWGRLEICGYYDLVSYFPQNGDDEWECATSVRDERGEWIPVGDIFDGEVMILTDDGIAATIAEINTVMDSIKDELP